MLDVSEISTFVMCTYCLMFIILLSNQNLDSAAHIAYRTPLRITKQLYNFQLPYGSASNNNSKNQ